jgi:hypothetical protein
MRELSIHGCNKARDIGGSYPRRRSDHLGL